jgi:protein transport protein SEC20
MSATELAQQLAQLSESLKTTNALITKLSKLAFQPGSEPLDSDANTVRVELSQDIHDSLKQLEEELELLKQEAEDLTTSTRTHTRRDSERQREGARLSGQVSRLAEDLRHSRGHFRRAQLTAKKNAEAAKQKERELVFARLQQAPLDPSTASPDSPASQDLFAGRSRRQHTQKNLTRDELELQASTDVTAALRRTHALLSTELSRSRFAQETLEESSAALADLGETYTDLGSVIDRSRELLGTLLRSQKSDTWYLETAFYILLATLGWLIFRRILFGPFIKLPLFLLNVAWFLVQWVVFKPIWLFLTLTGVVTTTNPATGYTTALTSSSRPPLIVQPSASSPPQRLPYSDRQAMADRGGIPVGAGGAGVKRGKDGQFQSHTMEEIATRHEASEARATGQAQGTKTEGEGQVKRADGTVLQKRGEDTPRNPKKKMFEADVEDARQKQSEEEQKQERQQQQGGGERVRDEL